MQIAMCSAFANTYPASVVENGVETCPL